MIYLALAFLFEVWLLVVIGSYIGAVATVLWIVITVLFGSWHLRFLGYQSMHQLRSGFHYQVNDRQIFKQFLKFIGCIAVILPGFGSDIVGFLLWIPFVQHLIIMRIKPQSMNRPKGRIYKVEDPVNRIEE